MTTVNTMRAVTPPVAAWRDQLPTLIRVYGIILTLVLLVAVVGIGNPAFLSGQNMFNMLSQWAPAGIMAVGMTFVILTGGFDLSVASGYSLCAVVAAYVGQSYPPSIAFAAAIVVGLLFGLANGLLVAVVRINPFITTVGSGFIINGVALVLTKNAAFLVDDPSFGNLGAGRWHGVPYSGMLLILFLLVFGFILARTIYGEAIYSVGGNYEASRLSGIRVRAVVASTYVVLGGCIGLAGSIIASQLSSAQANLDPGIISMCSQSSWSAARRSPAERERCGEPPSGWESSPPSPTASSCSISVLTTSRSSRARSSSQRSRSTAV